MQNMLNEGFSVFYLELAILTVLAHFFGELARRLRIPAAVGELLVGVILGPTLLKRFFPSAQATIFPSQGDAHTDLATILALAIIFFLVAAGMEVDLRLVTRSRNLALPISLSGIIVPFASIFIPAFFFPQLLGFAPGGNKLVLAMFMGAACSVTSLPILSKILLDLKLFKTTFGMLLLSCAVLDDFIGWIVLGIVLALNQGQASGAFTISSVLLMVAQTVAFVVLLMTAGRWFCSRIIAFIYQTTNDSGRIIGLLMAIGLLCASCTAAIGIHGLLGAFMAGVIIGFSNLKDETRRSIEEFVNSFFGPLYFSAVGLSIDFFANFSLQIVLSVLAIACFGKIVGCSLAARHVKIAPPVHWAIGFGMNSRGSVEIVLATIGLQAHIIDEKIYVALIVMAVCTCCIAGVLLRRLAGSLQGDILATAVPSTG
jgi:Kef-type K+ transport system membrane component KefB